VHSLVGMSGNLSTGKCIGSDAPLLDSLLVTQHNHQIREVVSVGWKAPSAPWLKVNSNDSVIGNHGACGGLFRDHLGNFLGAFTCNLGISFVFTVEVHSFILAMEYVAQNGWTNIWLESDSTSALLVFKNRSLVPVCFETVGIMLVLLEFILFPLIFSVKVIVVLISWLIWVTWFMGRCGCRLYLLTCRRSFIRDVVVCLVIGSFCASFLIVF